MNVKILFILLSVALLCSCSNSRTNGTFFHETKELYAEKIPVNEIFAPIWITKTGNYLIIASFKGDTTLFLYDIPSLSFKFATGQKGGGPDDIATYPMFCNSHSDDYVYIRGYSHYSIRKIAIQPQGNFMFIDEYILKANDEYNHMNVINDSLLIYYNGEQLAVKKYDLKKEALIKEIYLKKEDHRESYYYSNRGFVAVNDSLIIFPYIYKKQIDIYNVDDLTLKIRIGDGKKPQRMKVYDDESIMYHYLSIYTGKNFFYVIYAGHKEKDDFSVRTLEVYDYDGNPVIKYTFDIIPFHFVVDEENGYIYGHNSNYEDYLLRYKL